MFDQDKWQEIFESVRRHKLRTGLTALGVFWGIFMLVLLLGASSGLQTGVEYQFRDDAINSIWLNPGVTSKPYMGLKEGRQIKLNNADYDFLLNEFDNIDHMTGRFYLGGEKIVKYDNESLSFNVRSVHADHQVLENTIIVAGRYISEKDVEKARKVAVIGGHVKEKLFGESNCVGEAIILDGASYTVIGEFFDTGGEWEMRNIYIPISTAQKLYDPENSIHTLMFTGGDLTIDQMKELESSVSSAIAKRKMYDPEDRKALRVFNLAEEYQEFKSLFAAIKAICWLVGILSIIAGVIGVSNIMLIIVKDRTKEIGIRKALGATPWSIISMILQESIFITAIAGFMGMAVGVGFVALASGITTEFFRGPQVHLGVVILATVILVVAGTLAGLIPAIQAARINPVLAMKSL